jgi:hypothetical protein
MTFRGFRAIALGGAIAVTLSLGIIGPAIGSPARSTSALDYPSWGEVEAARGNEAAKASVIANLNALLKDLQAEAARLGDEAVRRSAESDQARIDLDRATTTATVLGNKADAAAARADASAEKAAQIVAALYRSGGTDVTATLLLASEHPSSDLLYRLGALDKVGEQIGLALDAAKTDHNVAVAASAQADVAKRERDALFLQAQDALDAAQAAEGAADAAVAAQQNNLARMYAQLASLKNTTVQLEQQYQVGQQGANGGGGGVVVPGGGGGNDPAAAKAYAFSLLAQRGFGAEQNNCLLLLWNRESGWRTTAYNASSGAYGIPQSLPGSKMATVGADWRTNYATQVIWGVNYISSRYGNPCGAWAHSEATGWY